MEKASQAMKQIHGNLTPEKVDETMFVLPSSYLPPLPPPPTLCRVSTHLTTA